MTPEAAAKDDIKKGLERNGILWAMPVQFGYGRRMVDFYCTLPPEGRALLIEAKRFKAKPRAFQRAILDSNAALGGISVYAATCWADVAAAIKSFRTPLSSHRVEVYKGVHVL